MDNYVIAFSDKNELYGALISFSKDYIEFMEFVGDDIVTITEDENLEEFNRLKEKYYGYLLDVIK